MTKSASFSSTLGLSVALLFLSGAHAFGMDCTSRLQYVVHLPITELAGTHGEFATHRIRATNPITAKIAADYHLLVGEPDVYLDRLSPEDEVSCRDLASKIQVQLESYLDRRLTLLIEQADIQAFSFEYDTLYAPWALKSERQALQKLFGHVESGYLQLLLANLSQKLHGTRWEPFAKLQPHLEGWTTEWATLLGREAPGAVLFQGRRIAIQVAGRSIDEIQIFLFHELAHLADPRLTSGQELTEFETEQYAWTETLAYLDELRATGQSISPSILRLETAIRGSGVDQWVRWNLAARAGAR